MADAGRYFVSPADVAALVEAAEAEPGAVPVRRARGPAELARSYDWDDVAAGYEELALQLAGVQFPLPAAAAAGASPPSPAPLRVPAPRPERIPPWDGAAVAPAVPRSAAVTAGTRPPADVRGGRPARDAAPAVRRAEGLGRARRPTRASSTARSVGCSPRWPSTRGLTPNAVTGISAVFTAHRHRAARRWCRRRGRRGSRSTACLVLGYALDAADGQLARLRGGGSPAGEWLDHMVDAAKISSLHLAVLIGALPLRDRGAGPLLLIPMGYCVVDARPLLRARCSTRRCAHSTARPRGRSRTDERAGLVRSLLVAARPTTALLCLVFILLGRRSLFVPAYTVAVRRDGRLSSCLPRSKWFREMGRLPR